MYQVLGVRAEQLVVKQLMAEAFLYKNETSSATATDIEFADIRPNHSSSRMIENAYGYRSIVAGIRNSLAKDLYGRHRIPNKGGGSPPPEFPSDIGYLVRNTTPRDAPSQSQSELLPVETSLGFIMSQQHIRNAVSTKFLMQNVEERDDEEQGFDDPDKQSVTHKRFARGCRFVMLTLIRYFRIADTTKQVTSAYRHVTPRSKPIGCCVSPYHTVMYCDILCCTDDRTVMRISRRRCGCRPSRATRRASDIWRPTLRCPRLSHCMPSSCSDPVKPCMNSSLSTSDSAA